MSYGRSEDVVYCHLYVTALQAKKMNPKRASICSEGFAIGRMLHLLSRSMNKVTVIEKLLIEVPIILYKSCKDVGDMLSSQCAHTKKHNHECLLRII